MKRKLTSCFLILMTIGLSLQAADDYQVVLRNIAARVKEEGSPSLFVDSFGIFPTFLYHPKNVMPLSAFLELKGQNIVSVLRACQRGDAKRAGTNSKEISIVGSPQCFEAYFEGENNLQFTVLGSMDDINTPNSILQKALEYTGHRSSKVSKSATALALALRFDAIRETRAATLWYNRSIQNGSTVVAAHYLSNFLHRQSEHLPDERAAFMAQVADQTYKVLAETKGHLGSIRAIADSLERDGKFLEAAQWYKKAVLEKGHLASIRGLVGCLDDICALEDETSPNTSLLQFIKESYELAAHKFGDEEAVNRLADLMKKLDYERGDEDDCYALEKEVLAEQIALWPDKVSSNTMLRLALLEEESYNMNLLKRKRKWNKIYDMFLPAAQAGNVAAMVKVYRLSLKGGDKDKAQFWSDRLKCLYWGIFVTAKVKDALLYLAYLGVFGDDLLEAACSELKISSDIFKEAADEYSFKPSVDPDISGFPADEALTLCRKRKREEDDEVWDFERVIKKTKHKESTYNNLD